VGDTSHALNIDKNERAIDVTYTDTDNYDYYGIEITFKQIWQIGRMNGGIWYCSLPGKSIVNAYVESFNGKFRDESLNVNWFLYLEDAAKKIEDFRWEYNHFRPHSSINDLTPKEFIILHENTPETLISVV